MRSMLSLSGLVRNFVDGHYTDRIYPTECGTWRLGLAKLTRMLQHGPFQTHWLDISIYGLLASPRPALRKPTVGCIVYSSARIFHQVSFSTPSQKLAASLRCPSAGGYWRVPREDGDRRVDGNEPSNRPPHAPAISVFSSSSGRLNQAASLVELLVSAPL